MVPSRAFGEFRRNEAEMAKKPQTYPLRYVEDFFDVSNDVAVKLSKCAAGNHFSPPCQSLCPK
jgi:hypothetical protein